jgi:hypothetical protein
MTGNIFKLKYKNKNGSFSISLNRDIPHSEITAICQLAINLVKEEVGQTEAEFFGPPKPDDLFAYARDYNTTQTKLGEKPVDSINLGSYTPVADGVRIKMLSFTQVGRIAAFKAFRDETGISLIGVKEIVYGNYPCPVLTVDVAVKILEKLKAAEVYAKIVPAFSEAA